MTKKRIFIKIIFALIIYAGMMTSYVTSGKSLDFILGFSASFLAIISLLLFRMIKEYKTPSFYMDERNKTIAYKADSVAFSIFTLILLAVVFTYEHFTFLHEVNLFTAALVSIYFLLFLKIIIYSILKKIS